MVDEVRYGDDDDDSDDNGCRTHRYTLLSGLAIIRCEINLSGPLGHLQPALRFGSRPAFPCGQRLTGQKGPMRGGLKSTSPALWATSPMRGG